MGERGRRSERHDAGTQSGQSDRPGPVSAARRGWRGGLTRDRGGGAVPDLDRVGGRLSAVFARRRRPAGAGDDGAGRVPAAGADLGDGDDLALGAGAARRGGAAAGGGGRDAQRLRCAVAGGRSGHEAIGREAAGRDRSGAAADGNGAGEFHLASRSGSRRCLRRIARPPWRCPGLQRATNSRFWRSAPQRTRCARRCRWRISCVP